MSNNDNEIQRLIYATAIPKEMFWAYESVRQSGLYNMFCIRMPVTSNSSTDRKELIQLIDDVFIKYCAYTNADISKKEYKHVTSNHVLLIQHVYNELLDAYSLPPQGVVNIQKKTTTTISI